MRSSKDNNRKRFSSFITILLIFALFVSSLSGCSPKPNTENTIGLSPSLSGEEIGNQTTGESTGTSSDLPTEKAVKNVIYMIADGGGYDNFTLADKVKKQMTSQGISKLAGAKTEISTNLLENMGISSVNGLYLNAFLVGSANTLLQNPNGAEDNYVNYITDSSAAATALSSGYKTNYAYAGIDEDGNPRASLPELARMNGMSTGLVTTKSYLDATPLAFFTGHCIHRREYQDASLQALLSGIDVVIGEGTLYGDMVGGEPSSHPDISASSMGYTVARNKTELVSKANSATKLWAAILGVANADKELKTDEVDLVSDLISYDVDAALSSEQPSLLDMTKAALQVLGNNINNPDGFFLMVEGGALDNAAESGYLRPAVGEYLAFDETFGYCVNWAAQRGDTIVIAVPDHDSGGFYGIESCENALIDSIISGYIGNTEFHSKMKFNDIKSALKEAGADTENMKLHGSHTDMAVPICLYAPETVRQNLLEELTLPTAKGNIRTGNNQYYAPNEGNQLTWYTSSALNNDYTIDNTKIAPAIAKILELGSLDEATKLLFQKIGYTDGQNLSSGEYGGSIVFNDTVYENEYSSYVHCVYENKEADLSIERNTTTYTLNGEQKEIPKIGKLTPKPIFVLEMHQDPSSGTFYVPYSVLTAAKLG